MATHNQKLILASNLLIYAHYFRAAAGLTERRRQIRFPCGRWNSSCPVTFWKLPCRVTRRTQTLAGVERNPPTQKQGDRNGTLVAQMQCRGSRKAGQRPHVHKMLEARPISPARFHLTLEHRHDPLLRTSRRANRGCRSMESFVLANEG